jgi:hypothetical protein
MAAASRRPAGAELTRKVNGTMKTPPIVTPQEWEEAGQRLLGGS